MSERTRDFMVGLVSIGGLLAISALLLLFGELESVVNPKYQLSIRTDQAAGIRSGSNVLLNGVPIGVVDNVRLEEGRVDHPVVIVAMVDQGMRIPDHVVPYAATALLGGASVLELDVLEEEPSDPPRFLPRDGSAELEFDIKFRLLEELRTELEARAAPFEDALEEFKRLSAVYSDVGKNVNALLQPQDKEALENGEQANIRTTIDTVSSMVVQAEKTMKEIERIAADEELRADVRRTIANANDMITRASETIDRIGVVAEQVGSDSDKVARSLVPAIDELSTTLASVRDVARRVTEGDGTAGQLLRNPDLYNSLVNASEELEATLTSIQVLLEQLREEGVDIQF